MAIDQTILFLVDQRAITALRVRVPTDPVPLAVFDLDGDVLVLLFHGLDSTCLRTVLARALFALQYAYFLFLTRKHYEVTWAFTSAFSVNDAGNTKFC